MSMCGVWRIFCRDGGFEIFYCTGLAVGLWVRGGACRFHRSFASLRMTSADDNFTP
jgi:hypothetical protein